MAKVLVLRSCGVDLTSFNEFQWPASGPVEAPDWDPTPFCGHGLHGLLWGEGDHGHLVSVFPQKYLVVEVEESEVVAIPRWQQNRMVKFPRGNVVYCGSRSGAAQFIQQARPEAQVAGLVQVGEEAKSFNLGLSVALEGSAESGFDGVAVALRGSATVKTGMALAGHNCQAEAGFQGIAVSGEHGKSLTGAEGLSVSSYQGHAASGTSGVAVGGSGAQTSAGSWGLAVTSGVRGLAKVGYGGFAVVGPYGWASAGMHGTILIGATEQGSPPVMYRMGRIGENGLEPDTYYSLDHENNFISQGSSLPTPE